jgi:hypothetical protein
MSLKMPVGKNDDFFIVGFGDDGKPGIGLQAGQTCTVSSADPNTVVIAQDATPRPTTADFVAANGTPVPAGTATIASGKVSDGPSPVLKTPVVVTSHLANADGSAVLDDTNQPVADVTDTVEVDPNLLKSEGILFGTPA